jgi:hypothetical protein
MHYYLFFVEFLVVASSSHVTSTSELFEIFFKRERERFTINFFIFIFFCFACVLFTDGSGLKILLMITRLERVSARISKRGAV